MIQMMPNNWFILNILNIIIMLLFTIKINKKNYFNTMKFKK